MYGVPRAATTHAKKIEHRVPGARDVTETTARDVRSGLRSRGHDPAFTQYRIPLDFPAMSPRGTKQRPSFTKVAPSISPDDVLKLIQERDQGIASDTRTAAERWLGDPPPHRSALAQRDRR
jgi:hypothetical protein